MENLEIRREAAEGPDRDAEAFLDLIFKRRDRLAVLGEVFERSSCKLHAETNGTGADAYIQLFLTNPEGQELAFSLDEARKMLVGDLRDFALTDEQLELVKRLSSAA